MIDINAKDYDTDAIIKMHPREKVRYFCASCDKEQIKNAGSIRSKLGEPLLCIGCNVSKSKKQGSVHLNENQIISSIEEIKNIDVKSRFINIKFTCNSCKQTIIEQAGPLRFRDNLVCDKCSREHRSMLRFGVKNTLSINQKYGVKETHSEYGIYKTRFGLIRNLWVDNFDERVKQLNNNDWIILDVNNAYGTILIQSTCCQVQRLIKMGTCKAQNIKCDCQKNGFSSKIEEKFFQTLKSEFSKYTLIHGYRNWNAFRQNNLKGNYEIDVFIKELSLGIEFNGTRWHDKSNQTRELNKIKIAKDNQLILINIWEDDWKSDQQTCINYIRYKIEEINERKNPQSRTDN